LAARTAESEARAAAKAQKDAAQRADAAAVWTQVRREEQKVLDRTAELKALRLAREAELRTAPAGGERKGARTTTKLNAVKVKRARVSTGN
jgi:hypothetical protein